MGAGHCVFPEKSPNSPLQQAQLLKTHDGARLLKPRATRTTASGTPSTMWIRHHKTEKEQSVEHDVDWRKQFVQCDQANVQHMVATGQNAACSRDQMMANDGTGAQHDQPADRITT